MTEENPPHSFKDRILAGRTVGKYIAEQIDAAFQDLKKNPDQTPLTKHDKAVMALIYMDGLGFTEEELANSIEDLGLTPEEEAEFMTKTLPEAREHLQEEDRKEAKAAEERRKDLLQKYTEEWGLGRLDGIANYFKSQIPQLELIDPQWQDALTQYKIRRPQVEEILGKIENPKAKTGILMQELYRLTNLHPSETLKVFKAEQETKSNVYIDSLFQVAVVLRENATGKDPDFENIEAGPLTITLRVADNPEHMAWVRREQAMVDLKFGAKTPNETYAEGKVLLKPFKEHMKAVKSSEQQ